MMSYARRPASARTTSACASYLHSLITSRRISRRIQVESTVAEKDTRVFVLSYDIFRVCQVDFYANHFSLTLSAVFPFCHHLFVPLIKRRFAQFASTTRLFSQIAFRKSLFAFRFSHLSFIFTHALIDQRALYSVYTCS